jgi:YebC/PmpR family DNA-binding regulatory protein
MAGHNKWSKVKRKKGAADAKRSKIFSRVTKEIEIAIKDAGGDTDPTTNAQLRTAINNAKGVNMPKDNVERAINKAKKDPGNLEKETYEGYLPHGIGVIVECLTDNKNRTVSSVRAIFNKRGGNLGTKGSLSFQFEQKGVFTIPIKEDTDPEEFELEMIDAGIDDIESDEEYFILTTSLENFGSVQKKLEEMEIETENAELKRIPITTKSLEKEDAIKTLKIIDEFEENEDVQHVFHNLEITDEVVDAMENE